MNYATPILLLIMTSFVQNGGSGPIRIGPTRINLTDRDVAEIERVTGTIEKPPWLLSCSDNFFGEWAVLLFLNPESTAKSLRRGRTIAVKAPRPEKVEQARVWSVIQQDGRYAQVAVDKRPFDQILNSQDINRPFSLFGNFDEGELISIVEFIRSNVKGPNNEKVEGGWPIGAVIRDVDGTIRVSLQKTERSGQLVELARYEKNWKVTKISFVFYH